MKVIYIQDLNFSVRLVQNHDFVRENAKLSIYNQRTCFHEWLIVCCVSSALKKGVTADGKGLHKLGLKSIEIIHSLWTHCAKL